MAAVAGTEAVPAGQGPVTGEPARRGPAGGRRPRAAAAVRSSAWRWAVLLLAALYFLLPMAASLEFSLRDRDGGYSLESYRAIVDEPGFASALWTSVKLGLITVALTIGLLVPTMTLVHLRFPWLRRVIETITVLPLVIPPVVLVIGVLGAFEGAPNWLIGSPTILAFEYVILAMPFAYRSLDAGIGAIDLRTLVEASRSLGGGWATELFRVVLPNLRGAVLGACVLTLALVLGEFAMASLLLWSTFPTWVVQVAGTQAGVSVAVSVLSLFLTWALLMLLMFLGDRRGRRSTFLGGVPGG
ncbi:ABC transporter permease subunit [Frankia sp. CN7]|uniref:ABC transporter permease n=1 Tax=Frankia nepalensis TaxID=1836974 RepID=UPI001933692D|nr:ABC transporter permease subunit [Frankia nepalensis]MBL7497227.1 ABC transporter permease subunit [Frankia nepalensis]